MRAMPETISNRNQNQIIFLFCNNKKGACFYFILFTPHIVRLPNLLAIYQEIDSEKRGQSAGAGFVANQVVAFVGERQ